MGRNKGAVVKNLINKITNKDRLIKLYGCEECGGKGYPINRDSQVLDIVHILSLAREGFHMNYGHPMYKQDTEKTRNIYLASALIKLIELANIKQSGYRDQFKAHKLNDIIDKDISAIISTILSGRYEPAFHMGIAFCNHHNINIWDSVKEILEGEG